MKKVLLIIDNFTPDLGAASFRFESVVRFLLEQNIKVSVLCSYPNRINLNSFEELNLKNLEIFRINNTPLEISVISRAITYLKFMISSLRVGTKLGRESDLIIASSPQLLVGVTGALIKLITRKKFILDIRDLWPDIVIDMEVMSKWNPIYLGLKILEGFMYSQATKIVYNSPGFEEYLNYKIKNKEKILITNGIDNYILEYFKINRPLTDNKKSNYRMMYAGNLGIAQDIIILIKLALKYKNELEILLIGKGSQEELIVKEIKDNNIDNIKIISSIPRDKLLNEYLKSDILFLQLKDIEMFKKTIPSKIFEYMASGKPIIYGLEGIGRKILQDEFKQKYYFKCNNFESLCQTYEKLKDGLKENELQGVDLNKLEMVYSRDNLSKKYIDLIIETLKGK